MQKTKEKNIFLFPIKKLSLVIVFLFFVFSSCPVLASILINEVMYDPEGSDNSSDESSFEWIELFNNSYEEIDLSSWDLRSKTYFSLSALKAPVPPEGFIVIFEGSGNDKNLDFSSGNVAYLYMNKSGSQLGNDNGEISLYESSDHKPETIQDYIAYGKPASSTNASHAKEKGIWNEDDFISKCSSGKSLELISIDNNSPIDWQESAKRGGSPGKENSKKEIREYPAEIRLNEILPNPSGDESQNEYIELYNPTDSAVDLEDWILKDKSSTHFIFPEGSGIGSQNFLVIYRQDFRFAINNSNESIFLLDPEEKIVSEVSFSDSAKEDVSYNFSERGWRWSQHLTPGEENEFDDSPDYAIRKDKKIYKNTYANFSVKVSGKKGKKTKVVWDFGDGHKSYKQETRHKYEETGKYTVTLKISGKSEDALEEFEIKVEKFPERKVRIIALSPNPKGSDTENEWIQIQNQDKKEVNLLGWSVASGWKNLSNHPIREDFVLAPGEIKILDRTFCSFSLANTKDKLELRYPSGKAAQKLKYQKDKIIEDEIYKKIKGGWQWEKSQNVEDTPSVLDVQDENPVENVLSGNLFTPDESKKDSRARYLSSGTHIALTDIDFLDPKTKVIPLQKQYLFNRPSAQKHWALELLENLNYFLAWIF